VAGTTFLLILSSLAAAPSEYSDSAEASPAAVHSDSESRPAEAPATEQRPVSVKEVYRCDFDASVDRNFDLWPDGWTRKRGPGYPHFVKMSIAGEGANAGLRINLDGGGGLVTSPPIPISPHYSFELTARLATSRLKHDAAWLTLELLDRTGKTLETFDSPLVTGTNDQTVRIGPITPASPNTTHAAMSFHLEPRGKESDLFGSATLSELRIVRLPRMSLAANVPTHLYTAADKAEIRCEVSGIPELYPVVRFDLLDHEERIVGSHSEQLHSYSDKPAPEGFAGFANWKPPLAGYGFYRVRASLHSEDRMVLERTISLAVLRPMPAPDRGEFGWTLPAEDRPLPTQALAALLGQVGIHWAKLPVWFDTSQADRAESIASFAEQASIQGIELVGILDQPPEELRNVFREQGKLPVASVFIEPQLWGPAVSPVMTRLSLKIRWWQLGDDADASYIGFPNLPGRIAEIKKQLEQYGQELRLGFSWRWPYAAPEGGALPPWAYLSYSGDPALTADELSWYLSATNESASGERQPPDTVKIGGPVPPQTRYRQAGHHEVVATRSPRTWLVLQPIERSQYGTEARVRDLVSRMVAAKIHGVGAAFVPEPFHEEHGLMNADATPGELLLPWRTTSRLLSGTEYVGQIELPGGSTNHVFARGKEAVMVLWNDRPVRETITSGESLERLDVWGRSSPLSLAKSEGIPAHEIEVGPVPTFVIGLSAAVARWQVGLAFEEQRLASIFGREQTIHLLLPNTFGQGVGGEVTLHAPKSWSVDVRPVRFKLNEAEQHRVPLSVLLSGDANSGPQPVRLDFDLTADRNYRFSVYRTLQLGLEDVQIELVTRLREDGVLLVEQHLTNLSDKSVSFQCTLFPPGRRRETRQAIDAPHGRTTLTFALPRGEELVGQKLWLRAEEIRGQRVLNHTVTAER
jgi:hypothetical protein